MKKTHDDHCATSKNSSTLGVQCFTTIKASFFALFLSHYCNATRLSFHHHRRNVFSATNFRNTSSHPTKYIFDIYGASPIRKHAVDALFLRGGGNEETTRDKEGLEKLMHDVKPEPSYELPESGPSCGVILIDSFCPYHGRYLDRMAQEAYGVGVVNALSNYLTGYMYFSRGLTEHMSMRIPDDADVKEWAQKIPFKIVGIICESDSGLADSERLGEKIGISSQNGFNEARRNKFIMNKKISEYGLQTTQQQMCATLEEAISFAKELGLSGKAIDTDITTESTRTETSQNSSSDQEFNSGLLGSATNISNELSLTGNYCVIKPYRGVASDDVHFCQNIDAVEHAFQKVHGSTVFGSTIAGEKHESVLVQEFAAGTEYALDIVSKAGEHKCAVLWRYDKRAVNGAPFVYHATEIVDALTPQGQVICEYAKKALDALGIKWGISHTEVIVNEEGPRLVEVNCRQHNTDFVPLTTACVGYNALDMLLSAYLGDELDLPPDKEDMRLVWSNLPDLPVSRAYGAIVHLVCHVEGVIMEVHENIIEEIKCLPSVVAMEVYPEFSVGNHVEKTINIRSDSGWVHLISDDEVQFQQDYNRIVELMPLMFSVSK